MKIIKLIAGCAIICVSLCNSLPSKSQSYTVTILAVQKALEETLSKFNSTLNTAGNEVRSSGASLASNAQNLLTDLNSQLGGRLRDSIDELKGAQRQLANDAIEVTNRLNQATIAILTRSGEEARATIAEADIVAYNASYSLPCRNLTPRIVYVSPSFIRVGSGNTEVHLRGNFLDLGQEPAATVEGVPARIISRSRNEIVLELPLGVLAGISTPRSLAIKLNLKEEERNNLWLYCRDKLIDITLSTAMLTRPALSFQVTGVVNGSYQTTQDWTRTFNYSRSDNDCGASFDDNQQFCAPEGYHLKANSVASIHKVSANCNSSIGDPQIAGARCVEVRAHLGGCGYDNLLVAKNCKGRGFFEYNVTVNAENFVPSNIPDFKFDMTSRDATQKSFQAAHPDAPKNFPNAVWRYSIQAVVSEGGRQIKTVSAGDGNPNPDGVTTRVSAGVVYINILD